MRVSQRTASSGGCSAWMTASCAAGVQFPGAVELSVGLLPAAPRSRPATAGCGCPAAAGQPAGVQPSGYLPMLMHVCKSHVKTAVLTSDMMMNNITPSASRSAQACLPAPAVHCELLL